MGELTTRLLCTGDIHMGRRPSRLPSSVDGGPYSASKAWLEVVDRAVELEVHALVLTGDVVDRENRYYEALGPLEAGLLRLADAGIQTFAVAGNHDFDVFPELADSLEIEGFHLLGAGGEWTREPLRLATEGEARLFFDGWSFPATHHQGSPLDSYPRRRADAPVIGLVHADVGGGARSRYAPVDRAALEDAPVDFWLLGHIHQPRLHESAAGASYLFPGSPQPLDPGEPGVHGPWLLHVSPRGEVEAEQVATASVRYEPLEVDLDGAADQEEARARVQDRLLRTVREELGDRGPLEQLVCRLTLTGRTAAHRELGTLAEGVSEDLERQIDDITVSVDRIHVSTRPALDLEQLAESRTPMGELARLVRALDRGEETEEIRVLLERATERVRELERSNTYRPVLEHDDGAEPAGEVDIRELLRQGALSLMDELDRQTAGSGT